MANLIPSNWKKNHIEISDHWKQQEINCSVQSTKCENLNLSEVLILYFKVELQGSYYKNFKSTVGLDVLIIAKNSVISGP